MNILQLSNGLTILAKDSDPTQPLKYGNRTMAQNRACKVYGTELNYPAPHAYQVTDLSDVCYGSEDNSKPLPAGFYVVVGIVERTEEEQDDIDYQAVLRLQELENLPIELLSDNDFPSPNEVPDLKLLNTDQVYCRLIGNLKGLDTERNPAYDGPMGVFADYNHCDSQTDEQESQVDREDSGIYLYSSVREDRIVETTEEEQNENDWWSEKYARTDNADARLVRVLDAEDAEDLTKNLAEARTMQEEYHRDNLPGSRDLGFSDIEKEHRFSRQEVAWSRPYGLPEGALFDSHLIPLSIPPHLDTPLHAAMQESPATSLKEATNKLGYLKPSYLDSVKHLKEELHRTTDTLNKYHKSLKSKLKAPFVTVSGPRFNPRNRHNHNHQNPNQTDRPYSYAT